MPVPAFELQKTRRKASYDDVLDAPPHKVAQVISGNLHLHPRPIGSHIMANAILCRKIATPFQDGIGGPGGWWIVSEPEIHLEEDIVVPDIAGWRKEKLPKYPYGAFVTVSPDWVCEILSPSTKKVDLGDKWDVYAREGVSHIWFIDPGARSLEAFARVNGKWLMISALTGDDALLIPPFENISIPLSALWP